MRLIRVPIALLMALTASCAVSPGLGSGCKAENCGERLVYIGTRGDKPGAEMFGAWFDESTGELRGMGPVADVARPTWLTADPDRHVLYSVSESGNDGKSQGQVFSFAVDPATGKLTQLSEVASGGGGPTHLDYDPRSHSLFVAHYGNGALSVLPVDDMGRLAAAASLGQNHGSGPHRRQASPHAHGATLDPGGRFVLVPDLGADRTFIYRFDPATRQIAPAPTPFAQTAPGAGPRHIAFGADGRFAYLATELTAQVIVYRWDAEAGELSEVQTVDLLPADFAGIRSGAEIAVSREGRYLYVSTRDGVNAIHAFAVDPRTGELTRVQQVETGTKPWSFAFSPSQNWLLVAEAGDGTVSVYRRNPGTGMLSPAGRTLAVPEPVNVTFVP